MTAAVSISLLRIHVKHCARHLHALPHLTLKPYWVGIHCYDYFPREETKAYRGN